MQRPGEDVEQAARRDSDAVGLKKGYSGETGRRKVTWWRSRSCTADRTSLRKVGVDMAAIRCTSRRLDHYAIWWSD